MPNISKTVPHEVFEAMRERAELAQTDGNPEYEPPVLPTFPDLIEIEGGYPQPKWPDDVILPEKKEAIDHDAPANGPSEQPVPIPPPLPDHIPRPEAQPEPEAIETSQADEIAGEHIAHTTFAGQAADWAAAKVQQLEGLKLPESERPADTGDSGDSGNAIGGAFRDIAHGLHEIGGKLQSAVDAASDDIVETGTDDVVEAETVTVEADEDSDPYDSAP